MKHEITSMNTKKALSASLKKFMEHKPFSKISVSEIIADCGVNRKTFYYHFEDIYALLKWTLEQEVVNVVKQFDLLVNSEEAIIFVADYVDENIHILNCVYDAIGRDELKNFFFADFQGITRSIIDQFAEEKNIKIEPAYREFVVMFYTEALAGILVDYFQHRNKRNRDEVIQYTLQILKKSIPAVL